MSLPAKQGSFQQPRFLSQNYDLPEDFLCVRVIIPNSLSHKRLLASLVNIPTQAFTWQSDTDEARQALAQLWQAAYTENDWGDGCVDCEQIIECIENDEDVRNALNAWFVAQMTDGGTVRDAVYAAAQQAALDAGRAPYGEPLPDSIYTYDIGGAFNPTCDPDILWSQCLQLVQATNRIIEDTLEKAEVASNANELAQFIAELPFLNLAARQSGITSAIEAVDKVLEILEEGYVAQYTSDVENEIACSLFCACQSDCIITVERIVDVMNARVSVHGTFPVFGTLGEWLTWFASVGLAPTSVVDIAFYAAYGALKVANFLFFDAGNFLLDTIVAVAADDPSSDWLTLCEDCNWCYYYDFVGAEARGWAALSSQATLTSAGWEKGATAVSRITIQITFTSPIALSAVRVERTAPTTTGDTQTQTIYTGTGTTILASGSSTVVDALYEFTASVSSLEVDVVTDAILTGTPVPGAIFRITLYGLDGLPVALVDGSEC